MAISYTMIPDAYRLSVKKAIDKKDISLCPKLQGKGAWISKECALRIVYNSGKLKECERWPNDSEMFASCYGVIANKKKDESICDSFKNQKLNTACSMQESHFSTIQTNYLDKKVGKKYDL